MRAAWPAVALLLLVPALGGCLSFLKDDAPDPKPTDPADVGYDPSTIRILDVKRTPLTITSFDGVELAATLYEPITDDVLPGNVTPTWGTVIFAHGWGFFKEQYEGLPGALSGQGVPVPDQVAQGAADNEVPYGINRLEAFARAGLIAVAYDARGFGQSGGSASVAGPAEMADLNAVLDYVANQFPSNGRFGVLGGSYGGGHAFNALVGNPRVATAVPMYGWVDLYDGLAPGNVPKLEWAALLGGVGVAGSQANVDPILAEWYEKAVTRSDLATVKAQMAIRSSLDQLPATNKPLFVCQGLQETLFPQADMAWTAAAGFTRVLLFTGGHGTQDTVCWDRALVWMRHFLGGYDGDVSSWPALTTVGVEDDGTLDYAAFPQAVWYALHPRDDRLVPTAHDAVFTVEQRLLANPFNEPSGVWDQLGLPTQGIPQQMRQDPTALFFRMTFDEAAVLMGAAGFEMALTNDTAAPFQVTGILFKVDGNGRSQILTRGAYAAVDEAGLNNGTVTLRFHWTKANFAPGDQLVLRVGANDESWFMPYPTNYAVDFTGQSRLHLPFFEG